MGLRTTNRTPLLPISKQSLNNSELPSTSFLSLSTKSEAKLSIPNIFLPSDAAFSGKMAPALTEPLSPTNKLTSSATLASPRPTAANSPLQQNNNNNSQTNNNNNNDTIAESIEENSTNVQSNVTQNPSVSEKDKTSETVTAAAAIVTTTAKPVVALAPKPSAPSNLALKPSSKGAFQLAFEQSVGVRKTSTPTSTVVNGGLSTNATTTVSTSQMGPMSNSKASQQPSPLGAANSSPLIKSKITNIDAETAAKIITSQFEDFPSDIEEAITAEICLRQKLKSSEEEQPVAVTTLEPKPDLQLGENLLQEPKKSAIKPQDEDNTEKQTEQLFQIGSNIVDRKEPTSENQLEAASKPLEAAKAALNSSKINIISVQELPPIKTDSTVTASEDDNIEERLKQLDSTDDCQMPQITQGNVGDEIPSTPPRNPSAQIISQITTPTNAANTSSLNSLTPLSTTSTLCGSTGGGQAKDFKDNNSEMDHDIEEDLLQVLKGFDPNTAANDICDLAGFLSEYGMNYEDVNPPTAKENPIKEVQLEIEKNQQTMQRKIDFLSRRLRKLQARYMSKQASEEISGLFEWSARTTKRKNSSSDHQQMSYSEERYHPVTTTTMRSVLKKIEDAANSVQQVSPVKQASGKSSEFTSPKSQVDVVVPTYDEKVTEEIAYVSGRLQAEMREVQSAIDSDATASSSGGESADEMVPYNNLSQETMPITKRAAWRYSRDRAAIASRWTWLVSQISDLEFKIRQHTELHQQLRQRKGKVILIDTEAAGATSTGIGVGPNGYRGALPGATAAKSSAGFTTVADENELEATAGEDAPQGACRTRAFQSNLYRKRKLFQTANVHTISKKAARPSTIKCGCQWPLHPCALCTGRSDPTAPRDLPDTMMKPQRVALLDPGFHPVLSFSEDIANSIFFEKIARDNEWQNRVARSTAKAVVRGALAAQRAAEKEEQRGNHATSGRITPTTPQNSSISSATGTTGKRKYTKRNHQDGGGGSHSTTPLVANKVGKGKKKKHHHYRQQRNRSPDYVAYPRKTTSTTTTTVNNNHQTLSQQHQSHHRNAEQFNHLPAHSSLNYPNSKNNKIRKLSSASTAAINSTTATTLNHHVNSNNILNSNYHNLQQHHSYNNELNFLHCDSLDGDSSTNGLGVGPGTGLTGRSRTSSPTHGGGHHKYERSLERRSRTSYDIDNIVIPYSVAAATRVELLPYKEIPTPNWRIIDYDAEEDLEAKKSEKNEEESKSNANNLEADDDEQPDEDISDEAMILRHERALTEERRKFQTFLKFPYSTRSRANRRIDSRAESSGANTPDPTSPAPNTPSVGGDQESIPSPLAPSTPMTPLDSIAETGEATNNPLALDNTPSIMSLLNSISRKQERRRTVSTKKEKDEHRRSSTPDPRDQIPPYEPLKFPIPNDLFESMLKMMPSDDLTSHQTKEDCPQSTNKKPSSVASTTTNGFGDKNTCTNTSSQLLSSSGGGGSVFVAAAQKNVCDQKLNNSLDLKNSQKSTEQQHLHITGEDDGVGAEDGDDVCDEEDDEDEEVDPDHFYRGEAVVTNGVNSNYQMRAPPAPTTASAVGGGIEEFVDEFQQAAFMCRNNLLGCSDTESLESENDGDDDPNDPEWKQEEIRK